MRVNASPPAKLNTPSAINTTRVVSRKSHVRSGGGETAARALAFSELDMSTFCDNFAAKVAYLLPNTRDDYPASQIVCTTAARLLRPCKIMVSQIEWKR
jgi:hypothetical protein